MWQEPRELWCSGIVPPELHRNYYQHVMQENNRKADLCATKALEQQHSWHIVGKERKLAVLEHVRCNSDGGSREGNAASGVCVVAWRGKWIVLIDLGLHLGPGDSTYAESFAGIQGLFCGVRAPKNRSVLLIQDCRSEM